MGKLGKILAPIVAILAILTAVVGFMVSSGFKLYRERASKMAQGLVNSASKLEAQTNTGLASKVTFKAAAPGVKEGGSLAFAEFKKSSDTFSKNVAAVEELADKVAAQRNEMADTVAAMSISLGLGEDVMSTDDLKANNTYGGKLALAKEYVAAFQKRDAEYVSFIKKYASAVGAGRGIDAIERLPKLEEITEEENVKTIVKAPDNSTALNNILKNIDALNKRKNAYEAAIKNVRSVISSYNEWKFNPSKVSAGNYVELLGKLAGDLKGVNDKLKLLVTVKAQLEKKESELKQREKEITDAREQIEKLSKDNEEMVRRLAKYGDGPDKRKAISDLSEIDPTTKGLVLLDNREWNYVIINLGNKDLVKNAEVIISKEGKYVASGKISKVEDEVSLVEISRRNDGDIPIGSQVFMGNNVKGNEVGGDD